MIRLIARAGLRRLRPFGPITPAGLSIPDLQAFVLGVRDGLAQPYEVLTSYNVDHLDHTGSHDVYHSLDSGINLGQWLASPLNHEQPR